MRCADGVSLCPGTGSKDCCQEEVRAIKEPPYLFDWCKVCKLLRVCYYQHGEREYSPMALDPSCAEGPA